MAKYVVDVPEVWTRTIPIEADSEEEAKSKVQELIRFLGEVSDIGFEYSHTLQTDNWSVYEEN